MCSCVTHSNNKNLEETSLRILSLLLKHAKEENSARMMRQSCNSVSRVTRPKPEKDGINCENEMEVI